MSTAKEYMMVLLFIQACTAPVRRGDRTTHSPSSLAHYHADKSIVTKWISMKEQTFVTAERPLIGRNRFRIVQDQYSRNGCARVNPAHEQAAQPANQYTRAKVPEQQIAPTKDARSTAHKVATVFNTNRTYFDKLAASGWAECAEPQSRGGIKGKAGVQTGVQIEFLKGET
ncbi:MAG TPA: hypothetical protein VN617_11840 [Rhodoferax sp.]|nr:hypothetical protein [Rhodoferax sp.]